MIIQVEAARYENPKFPWGVIRFYTVRHEARDGLLYKDLIHWISVACP